MPFLVIGLTGSIGSGKSTCAQALKEYGVKIIDADRLGHETYAPGSPLIPKLIEIFGPSVVNDKNEIDRRELGRLVFGSPERLKQLTDLVWPEIRRLAEGMIEKIRNAEDRQILNNGKSDCQTIVIEAALLIEAGWTSLVEHVIVLNVDQNSELRQRISRRNPELSDEDIMKRLAAQTPLDQRLEKLIKSGLQYSIINAQREKDEVINSVWQLVKRLTRERQSLQTPF